MKIGIIQATSQKEKNGILERCVRQAVADKGFEVHNFGIYGEENRTYSYVQIALCISMLLESRAVDFVVTGCSSGQGMMLACNSLPGVLCGYAQTVTDAYLFGRINDGNAISYPLGMNWGWAAEVNLVQTMKVLFGEPMGTGYPKEEAERKRRDTEILKSFGTACKKSLAEVLPVLDRGFVQSTLQYEAVFDYIIKNGTDNDLKLKMEKLRKGTGYE